MIAHYDMATGERLDDGDCTGTACARPSPGPTSSLQLATVQQAAAAERAVSLPPRAVAGLPIRSLMTRFE